jgi:hypothetical protein
MRFPRLLAATLALALASASPGFADSRRSDKPSAPVTLVLRSIPDGDGHRVILDATATRDVPAIELRVAGASARFGATRAGQVRRLETRVVVPATTGIEVVGAARVGTGARMRNRVTALRVGAPAAAPAEKPDRVVWVNGRAVAEVRE